MHELFLPPRDPPGIPGHAPQLVFMDRADLLLGVCSVLSVSSWQLLLFFLSLLVQQTFLLGKQVPGLRSRGDSPVTAALPIQDYWLSQLTA